MGSNATLTAGTPVKYTLFTWIVIYFLAGFSVVNATGKTGFSLRSMTDDGSRSIERTTLSSPLRLAQPGGVGIRLNQLEEQTRRLNGQIEELNFQLLQMQERMRKMQEDNEFRFQELEEKKQGKSSFSDSRFPEEQKDRMGQGDRNLSGNSQDIQVTGKYGVEKTEKIHKKEVFEKLNHESKMSSGTIVFDSRGKVRDMVLGKPLDLTARLPGSESRNGQTDTISVRSELASVNSARELYNLGYDYFQVGDYSFSQKAFSEFIERFPEDAKVPDAKFWLGESLLSLSDFRRSAKVFLDVYTNWPDSRVAPQSLLKLGVSLAGMEQRELACSTYARVFKKYPNASHLLKRRVEAEQKSANCLNG